MSQDEALGVWAEAAQDMASAGLAAAMGANYNCADLCNQVAEKSLQALHILRNDRRAPYNHDLRALGELVGAPPEILSALDTLTPYHPEGYLAGRTPEEADDEISGETAQELMAQARAVLRWARQYVMA